jgi:hypothetical protein
MIRREGSARRPILVTGVPRSGTTWLARLLATAPGTALAGREPMNPRRHQFALAGTLQGWTRLATPTLRQQIALRTSYRGWNPLVYSRYGARQWAGPLPGTRLVVKDPFALLSMPCVASITAASPVLLHRHPGAVLVSYRRMGWSPDLDEVQEVTVRAREEGGPVLADLPPQRELTDAEAMAHFWARLHEFALADATSTPGLVVVAHEGLAGGGPEAGRVLFSRLGLGWDVQAETELSREVGRTAAARADRLHNLDRAPAAVVDEWRNKVTHEDMIMIERVTAGVRARLADLELSLSPGDT